MAAMPSTTSYNEGIDMLRIPRELASSLAILIAAGAAAPAANALSDSSSLHSIFRDAQKNASVTFLIYNKGEAAQQVKVADTVYTLKPHDGVKVTAALGAKVCAAGESARYHDGELLITVTPSLKDATVSIN